MNKNYSLLHPFDPEAAKRGEAICLVAGFSQSNAKCEYIAGPDSGGFICVSIDGRFATVCPGDVLRMAPLCWVEGRPVYRGEVLYQIIGKGTGKPYVADHFEDGMLVIAGATGCLHPEFPAYLTWTPPKVKRKGWMNCYKNGDNYVYPSKKRADRYATVGRTACIPIEWEEPAEMSK